MATSEGAPQFEVIELHSSEPDMRVAFRHQMVKVNGSSTRSLEQVVSVEPPITEDEMNALISRDDHSDSAVFETATDKKGNTVAVPLTDDPEVVTDFTKWLLNERNGEHADVLDNAKVLARKSVVYRNHRGSCDKSLAADEFDVVHLGDVISPGHTYGSKSEPAVRVLSIPEGYLKKVYGMFASPKARKTISVEPPITEEEFHELTGQPSTFECHAVDPRGWVVPERYANSSEVFALELLKKIMILRKSQAGSLDVYDKDGLTKSLVKVIDEPNELSGEPLSGESQTRLSERLMSLSRVVVDEILEAAATNARTTV